MAISKTTIKFAEKRGLEVTEENVSDYNSIWIWESDNDMEPLFVYRVNNDGSLGYVGFSSCRADSIREELPAWIRDEKHLREVLDFIAKEIN